MDIRNHGGNYGGGGTAKSNIYVQENEPAKKEGVWIKTSIKPRTQSIRYDDFETSEVYSKDKLADIPYLYYGGSAVSIGTDIYLFSSGYGEARQSAYKYDTLTNSYTKLADIPLDFYSGSASSIGTDIYLFGGLTYQKTAYKFDTLTNSYTFIAKIPYNFYNGSTVSIGTDIYLLGSGAISSTQINYKYDTLTNSYTKLANFSFNFANRSAVVFGTDIYLLGGGDSQEISKYDTLTNKHTILTRLPYYFYSGTAVSIGTDIYLFGSGHSTYDKNAYKYDILTNSYTKMDNVPYAFSDGSAVSIGTDIYLLGSETYPAYKYMRKFETRIADIETGELVVVLGPYNRNNKKVSIGKTEINTGIKRAYQLDDSGLKMPFVHLTDGTKWVKVN